MLNRKLFACAMGCALTAGLLAAPAIAAIEDVRINEVYYNMTGTDTVEFFELSGPASQSLSGLSILEIDGDGTSAGRINRVVNLTGQSIPVDGLYVAGTGTTPNVDLSFGTSNTIQNGTGTFVLVSGFTGAVDDDIDTDNNGVIDPAYTALGTVIDGVGVIDVGTGDLNYLGVPVTGLATCSSGTGLCAPAGIARKSDGFDTDTVSDWCFTSFTAYPPATEPGTDGYDPASPGVSNSYLCDQPTVSNVTAPLLTTSGSPISMPITLVGDDSINPGPGTLSYIITSLPVGIGPSSSLGSGGSLSDPNGSTIVGTPYTLLSNGDVVDFTPAANASGWFQFKYKANDGAYDSLEATVDIFIQDAGRVVITEIMYDPANVNADNAAFDSDWEWVEITNLTEDEIFLGSFMDDAMTTANNIFFFSIPGETTQVMVKPDRPAAPFTLNDDFLVEWSPLTSGDVIQILASGAEGEPRLSDPGDVIRLFDSDGRLLDVVEYDNGNGWPTANIQSSIYLEFGFINTVDNDNGANWRRSAAGLCGAYATPETPGDPADSDVGSPAVLPTQICNAVPVAQNGDKDVLKDASPGPIITLVANDGDGDPLTYTIVTGPASGTLTDPLNGEANVTGGGALAGDQVRYTPAPTVTGDYTFTFKANDGTVDSNVATITVHILQSGDTSVRINEVYFNQDGADIVEFYELHGPASASLAGFSIVEIDGDTKGRVNAVRDLTGESIPADGLLVVGSPATPNVDLTLGGSIQNGTGTFLLVSGFTGAVNDDIDADDDGVADGAIGTIIDSVGVNDGGGTDATYFSAPTLMVSTGGIARKTDGLDTNAAADWCPTSEDVVPPSTGTGLDGFDAASPGEANNYTCGGGATPPVVVSAVSRKTHDTAGDFDIDPDAVGGIECRAGGPTLVIVTFDQAIQRVNNTLADVSVSSGTVSSLLVAGSNLEISMSGATNAAVLTISFPGIAAGADIGQVSSDSLCVRVLNSDANTDAATNIFDLIQIRNNLNQAVVSGNFRNDVTADGNINIFDLINTRNNLNQTVGTCGG